MAGIRTENILRDISLQQPVAALGEHRHVPNRGVHRQTDEPAKQHVECLTRLGMPPRDGPVTRELTPGWRIR